jgi:hypothetical protein
MNRTRSFWDEMYFYAPTQHCEVSSFRRGVGEVSVLPRYDAASLGLFDSWREDHDFTSRLQEPLNYPVNRGLIPQERITQPQHSYFTLISQTMYKEHLKLWHWFDKYLSLKYNISLISTKLWTMYGDRKPQEIIRYRTFSEEMWLDILAR